MPSFLFPAPNAVLPQPADSVRASIGLERWREAAERHEDITISRMARQFIDLPQGHALLSAVFGNSSYLGQTILYHLDFTIALCRDGPDSTFRAVLDKLWSEQRGATDRSTLMSALRQAKRRIALLIALADMANLWPLRRITEALSEFAAIALRLSCRYLLRHAAQAKRLKLSDPENPELESGLIILAMGKLGGGELNYSSDIDLIVLFDPEKQQDTDPAELQPTFVRLARDLVAIMAERTADGYVFRTDLRLRPDPAATPPAISVAAAETYYGSMGQNWERAAMIKARPIAGDIKSGDIFLQRIKPFIWRKYLDFAAIQDIHSIKRQIHAHRGGGTIAIEGHNVKLGRGGIREIEFLAQTFQLIWGGRKPSLRVPQTCKVLRILAQEGHIEAAATERLIASYEFLRQVEHRLQMIDDQQTHTLPDSAEGISHLAAFMGYPVSASGTEAFRGKLLTVFRTVEKEYAHLFEEEADLGDGGNLVFTGVDDDPDTVATLLRLGFRDPSSLCAVVRSWHHGRIRATRSQRARELLTELMPALLKSLAKTAQPDEAFARFAQFFGKLPAGIQLLTTLHTRPELLDTLAEIMGTAPELGERLARHPALLDVALARGFSDWTLNLRDLKQRFEDMQRDNQVFEDALNTARRFANDDKFQIGTQMLRGTFDPLQASVRLSHLAEVVVTGLYEATRHEIETTYGRLRRSDKDSGLAVIALGKFGGQEMTLRSDLDLVFVYEAGDTEVSDGARPQPPMMYYAKFAQRLITALTVLTGEGLLYDVDTRLRPSGTKGPIAVKLEGFSAYQRKDAWTWEHMALTRARTIAGPAGLRARIDKEIHTILTSPRDFDKLREDVSSMRRLISGEKPSRGPLDIKYRLGGLVDVEFLAQYLTLRHAAAHPEILGANTATTFERLGQAKCLTENQAQDLRNAACTWLRLHSFLRLTIGDAPKSDDDLTEGLKATLAKALQVKDYAELKIKLDQTANTVIRYYQAFLDKDLPLS